VLRPDVGARRSGRARAGGLGVGTSGARLNRLGSPPARPSSGGLQCRLIPARAPCPPDPGGRRRERRCPTDPQTARLPTPPPTVQKPPPPRESPIPSLRRRWRHAASGASPPRSPSSSG